MIISLTGFMGCGKSSAGRRLSELLCCSFMDLDDVIVEKAGRSIPEFFATEGEAAFRQMEREALCDIITTAGRHMCGIGIFPPPGRGRGPSIDGRGPMEHYASQPLENTTIILALGGGAVMQEECEKIVHESTMCIYLKASVETLLSHLEGQAAGRPLLNSQSSLRERILDLMAKRTATYERAAHHIIDTDGKTVEEIATEILEILS